MSRMTRTKSLRSYDDVADANAEREELDLALSRHERTLEQYDPKQALHMVRIELKRLHSEAAGRGDKGEMHRLANIWQLTEMHMRSFLQAALSIAQLARQLRSQRDVAFTELRAVYEAAADDWRAHPVTRSVANAARNQGAADAQVDSWDVFVGEMVEGLIMATGVDEDTARSTIHFLASKSLDGSGIGETLAALQGALVTWEGEQP